MSETEQEIVREYVQNAVIRSVYGGVAGLTFSNLLDDVSECERASEVYAFLHDIAEKAELLATKPETWCDTSGANNALFALSYDVNDPIYAMFLRYLTGRVARSYSIEYLRDVAEYAVRLCGRLERAIAQYVEVKEP